MEVLPFNMPPFSRIQWASKSIKDKYEEQFNKATMVYHFLEKESVIHGLRDVTTDSISPENMDEKMRYYANNGLVFLPIQKVGSYSGRASYHPPVEQGKPWHYYGVVARNGKLAKEFLDASQRGDHKTLGILLGYPQCCVDSFHSLWSDKITDQVWQQAENTSKTHVKYIDDKTIRLKDIPWEMNTMFKSFTIGTLFHSTHSFDCENSLKIAKDWIELGKELKIDGLREMEMFMRMPTEWDALKGIAYIKTPLFKMATNSVTCTERYVVQLEGTYFPIDSPKGTKFPWSESFTTIAKNGNKLTL